MSEDNASMKFSAAELRLIEEALTAYEGDVDAASYDDLCRLRKRIVTGLGAINWRFRAETCLWNR